LNSLIVVRSHYFDPSYLIYYLDQSSEPSFHSWIKPTNKINRNRRTDRIAVGVFSIVGRNGVGSRRTISTSNTMKIIARRKNRIENGIRAVFFGSNPHSNADDFSRSICDRILRNQARVNTNRATVNAMIVSESGRIIIRKS
jgi:hypothetical protein